MSDPLEQPVTYRELIDALANFKTSFKAELKAEFVTKIEFEARFSQFRHEINEDFTQHTNAVVAQLRQDLHEDFTKHTNTLLEQMQREVRLVDDRYRDLPIRVTRLENIVNAPKRRRRTTKKKPSRR